MLAKLNPETDENWANVWRRYAQNKGIKPLTGSLRRAKSNIKISGLKRGQLIIGGALGHSDMASIADSNGMATLSVWHRGNMTLKRKRDTNGHPNGVELDRLQIGKGSQRQLTGPSRLSKWSY